MDKKAIIEVLEAIAVLLELKDESSFKIRAYHNAKRVLESLEQDLGTLVDEGNLQSIRGIGKALAEKIETLYRTGNLSYYEALRASVPEGLIEMLEIPGLGPKKIKAIHRALGVEDLDALKAVCDSGQVASLPGFGPKSQQNIINGIAHRLAYSKRHLWWRAQKVAQPILKTLRNLKEVERVECAGSLRRRMETVGDLDFIVASTEPEPIMNWFCQQQGVIEVTAHGTTKSSVRFEDGLQADLRVVAPEHYCFALHHFTGSKEHNVQLRQRALSKGLSLSEWGLQPKNAEQSKTQPIASIRSETDLFEALELPYIPPELREGLGEIEAAEAGQLPQLVQPQQIRGTFHNHTTASDGQDSLEVMAAKADSFAWGYLGIADHSQSSRQAKGLSPEQLEKQIQHIRTLNASGNFHVHLFAGTECDILADGSLDYPDELLAQLDYVVVSIHSGFSQNEKTMTDRIVRAIEHPHSTMLGHATGRLLLKREPYAVDMERVIAAAIKNQTMIELNSHPERLDMDWRYWKKAAQSGLLCCINTDAHSAEELGHWEIGVGIARKGWLEAKQIFNTRTLSEVKTYFQTSQSLSN